MKLMINITPVIKNREMYLLNEKYETVSHINKNVPPIYTIMDSIYFLNCDDKFVLFLNVIVLFKVKFMIAPIIFPITVANKYCIPKDNTVNVQ